MQLAVDRDGKGIAAIWIWPSEIIRSIFVGGTAVELKTKSVFETGIICLALSIAVNVQVEAQDAHFHNAPASSAQEKNPYAGQRTAIAEGARLYTRNCGSCHGIGGRGTGNIPALLHGAVQSVPDGEVFWFITET